MLLQIVHNVYTIHTTCSTGLPATLSIIYYCLSFRLYLQFKFYVMYTNVEPCILMPLHSLTGPVGQPFASCLGGQQFMPQGRTHTFGTGLLLLAMSHYIGDPDMIPDHRP